jgi:hypothetical protein
MWERVNAESIEQRLSGDTLIDGRTQHEELSGEPSGLDTNMPFFSAGANITPSIAVPAVVEIPLAASRQNTRGSTPTVDNPGEHEQGDDEQEAYERGLEHWARTTQNGERLRPGPGWVRRTSSFPRVSLRRAFN